MSRNFAVLGKAALELPPSRSVPGESPAPAGEYAELIRLLFRAPSAVAIMGCGSGEEGSAGVCNGIAAELAGSGKRVVLVPADRLLRMDPVPIPDETSFVLGSTRNVWVWPPPAGQQIEIFKPRPRADSGNWLDSLRRSFDSLLLDCTSVDAAAGGAEVAAMADAAVLAVEAGRTTKQQVKSVQHTLQLRGVRLAGSILILQR